MFYLSKIVWAVLQPSSFIAILLAAGLLLAGLGRRSGTRILFFASALYAILGFSPLANWLLVPLEQRALIGAGDGADGAAGIIVLGGALNGTLQPDRRRILVTDSVDRMIEAVRLSEQYPGLPVIFSGGKGELFDDPADETEAELARRFFAGFKIEPPRLILEGRSRNTLENAMFTAELLHPQPNQRWILVTSAFHMARAKALFEGQGFSIIPRPGDLRTRGPVDRWDIFAKPSDGLKRMDLAAKEWVGICVSWLRGDIAWPKAS
jgi:uncharacterized SAM-binding protein YcdF (DUF218 family)